MRPFGPPRDERELLERARSLASLTLGDLAERLGVRPPMDLTAHKGWVGQLIEWALAATGSNRAVPDFTELGIEMKTVPVDGQGVPRESTFVTMVSYDELLRGSWPTSHVCRKTRRILWVPVESDDALPLSVRRIGQAIIWSPTPETDAEFEADWSEFRSVARQDLRLLGARLGRSLQLRPKARSARDRTSVQLEDGALVEARPLGFYLRRSFTTELFRTTYTFQG